jgi:hypothetical protein
MQESIQAGAILIKEGTPLPENLRLESESCVPGWRIVKNLDGYGLDRKIREAGWTFFCRAGETRATVFGIDKEKMVRRAIERILAVLKSKAFNSLAIVRVTSESSRRFLGVGYLTVSAQSRHIQEGSVLFRAKDQPGGTKQNSSAPEPKERARQGQGTISDAVDHATKATA